MLHEANNLSTFFLEFHMPLSVKHIQLLLHTFAFQF